MRWVILIVFFLQGCLGATAEKYTIIRRIEGQETVVEVLKMTGQGKARYADSSEIENKPFEIPEIPAVYLEMEN